MGFSFKNNLNLFSACTGFKILSVSSGYIYRDDLSKLLTLYSIVSVKGTIKISKHAVVCDKYKTWAYHVTFVELWPQISSRKKHNILWIFSPNLALDISE